MTHTLTTGQLRKLVIAVDDGNKWPLLTDDPFVNYVIDCMFSEEELPYDEQLYINELSS